MPECRAPRKLQQGSERRMAHVSLEIRDRSRGEGRHSRECGHREPAAPALGLDHTDDEGRHLLEMTLIHHVINYHCCPPSGYGQ